MGNPKFTHTGIEQSRGHGESGYTAKLRETQLYWISEGGIKYRKSDGSKTGEHSWYYKLLLDSIQPI
jgi:hypothetical protein